MIQAVRPSGNERLQVVGRDARWTDRCRAGDYGRLCQFERHVKPTEGSENMLMGIEKPGVMHGGAAGLIFGTVAPFSASHGPVVLLMDRQICARPWRLGHWPGQDIGSKPFQKP